MNRIGETYDKDRIDDQINILKKIKDLCVISGGWAWHFMSPPHIEYKHLHDHKDIDIFVTPDNMYDVIIRLQELGFYRMKTKYDNSNFYRYEMKLNNHKMVIDLFKRIVPFNVIDGWNIIKPEYLVTLYSSIHGSDKCFALKSAREIIKNGESPIKRDELIKLKS